MAGEDSGAPGNGPAANGDSKGSQAHSHNYRGASQHRGGHKKGGGNSGAWKQDNRPTKRRRLYVDRNAEKEGGNGGDGEDGSAAAAKVWEHRPSNMSIPFSAEEIAAEERRPKRKVAVLIGYAGTGYSGMQINHDEKTIEGDLFAAFVAAGAIAKANADDPKKSSLVRCARTDKGVHAAGNVISLKLIVEDADIVQKINDALPPQIRVWGIQRTINSFSCYQSCDSRWYEYLLPSYALLPPHPDSFLGREIVASAKRADEAAAAGAAGTATATYDGLVERLADVKDFWADVEREVVAPILDALAPEVRRSVVEQLHSGDDLKQVGGRGLDAIENPRNPPQTAEAGDAERQGDETPEDKGGDAPMAGTTDAAAPDEPSLAAAAAAETPAATAATAATAAASQPSHKLAVEQALRDIKTAYIAAKRRYRVSPARLQRLQDALSQFVGTHNFHNYTVQKSFGDASAKRHIKSFVVNPEPIQIRDTQWLSLKVHGQSFMMHQIRKMVAMAAMVARCGTDPGPALALSYERRRISVPRAPGFGLLLERPVFDSYNVRAQANNKQLLDFGAYETALCAFKDREIYKRIWDVEEAQNVFHAYFHQIDNFRSSYFLWAVPGGYEAAFERFGGQGGEGAVAGRNGPIGLEDPAEDAENPDEGEG